MLLVFLVEKSTYRGQDIIFRTCEFCRICCGIHPSASELCPKIHVLLIIQLLIILAETSVDAFSPKSQTVSHTSTAAKSPNCLLSSCKRKILTHCQYKSLWHIKHSITINLMESLKQHRATVLSVLFNMTFNSLTSYIYFKLSWCSPSNLP